MTAVSKGFLTWLQAQFAPKRMVSHEASTTDQPTCEVERALARNHARHLREANLFAAHRLGRRGERN